MITQFVNYRNHMLGKDHFCGCNLFHVFYQECGEGRAVLAFCPMAHPVNGDQRMLLRKLPHAPQRDQFLTKGSTLLDEANHAKRSTEAMPRAKFKDIRVVVVFVQPQSFPSPRDVVHLAVCRVEVHKRVTRVIQHVGRRRSGHFHGPTVLVRHQSEL